MGKAFYRTYRSKKLSEIVGQEHITTALDHALSNGTISHAYLFTGPRGVGKTSIARILAHEINSLPYSDDNAHLDIIEIDAASNRRIDEIRDLREKVHIAPTSAKFKVYIIDEVHMLTKEAFNALLKTLEEPPEHVVFILATTEAHKLPETIISRTQRYSFKPVDLKKVQKHLKSIAKKEKIDIDDEALELIAAHGEGSFRDSISLLDQAQNTTSKIGLADVQGMLGIAPQELIGQIISSISNNDGVSLSKALVAIRQQGYEAAQIAKQLSSKLRSAAIEGDSNIPKETLLRLLEQLIGVPATLDPYVSLEVALLNAVMRPEALSVQSTNRPTKTSKLAHSAVVKPNESMASVVDVPHISQKAKRSSLADSDGAISAPLENDSIVALNAKTDLADSMELDTDSWAIVLGALRKDHATLHGIIKSSEPVFGPGVVTLRFKRDFARKQVSSTKNKELVCSVIEGVVGMPMQLICESTDSTTPVDTISNIFGGAELLES